MIQAEDFLQELQRHGCGPYLGVPCSFLSPLINATSADPRYGYLAANNEGEAVAIAAGAYLAGRKPVVMFQNSGLGNAVSPLTSLTYPFRIPLLLIATQRGEPNIHDEPQHELMGVITAPLVELMGLGCGVFPREAAAIGPAVEQALARMAERGLPYVFVMRKDSVAPGAGAAPPAAPAPDGAAAPNDDPRSRVLPGADPAASPGMGRAEAIARVSDAAGEDAALIATTGKIGRELFTLRERAGNFYVVGSMGCASSIGLGVALHHPGPVLVLDGDGAALMRLEALVSIGHYRPRRLVHVVLDNGMHESTGGQPSLSGGVRLDHVAAACGYASAVRVTEPAALEREVRRALAQPGPHLIHALVKPGALEPLGRPTLSPVQVKMRFMAFLAARR